MAGLVALASLLLPAPTRADTQSDIPGVPLPGQIVVGQLGGPIYDVVYRIEVPGGYVLRVLLTGQPGTDFDLYLFDSSATTVLLNQGLVAKSTGPTSTEYLAYPSYAPATYYIDINGASDVQGEYRLTVQLIGDESVPVASLLLADGRQSVGSPTVSVRLTAYSSLAGVAEMAFSEDGVNFGSWQGYTIQSTWTFASGDGVKTLWAKVRSGTGVESAPASSSVVLDTTPPTMLAISPEPNSTVVGLRPTFRVRFSEPIEPTGWTQLGLIVQDSGGRVLLGSYSYDPVTRTGIFVPDSDLVAGRPYFATLGSVRDLAGNAVEPPDPWTVTPLIPTALSLAASEQVVLPGSSVVLSGTASVPAGSVVFLETRRGDSTEASGRTELQPDGGRITTSVRPEMNSHYRLAFDGSPAAAASTSPEVRVLVRRLVALAGVLPSSIRTVPAGRRVTLTAQVAPAGTGARLSFKLYRYDAGRRAYVYAGSYGRTTGSDGRASLTWTAKSGRYYWRVAVLSSPEYANNISPVYRWTVTGG